MTDYIDQVVRYCYILFGFVSVVALAIMAYIYAVLPNLRSVATIALSLAKLEIVKALICYFDVTL